MKDHFWIAMDIEGTLHVYCRDGQFHRLYDACRPMTDDLVKRALSGEKNLLGPQAHRFTGRECVTAECLPSWVIDSYYDKNLPQNIIDCVGR